MNDDELAARQISVRLKEERLALGLTPEAAAEAGGVSRTTQFAYEGGSRLPDAKYLRGLDTQGVDLVYVVTGRRQGRSTTLSPGERHVLDVMDELDDSDRATFMAMLAVFRRATTVGPRSKN